MTGTQVARRVSPDTIAANLETIIDMLKAEEPDKKQIARILLTSAANVRMLFELEADPESGEFRLQNYGQAWALADLLRNGDMVPSSYKTDEQVVIGLMKAMEIGVSPISGLANIMIINNRPSVWGDLAQALVQRTGVWERHLKEELNGPAPGPDIALDKWPNDYGFRFSIWRKGNPEPFVGEYTVGRAKRAGLWGNTKKVPWITDPISMLFNRARAFGIREGFADKLFGMGIIEEQRDFEQPGRAVDGGDLTPHVNLADDEPETEPAMPPNYAERGAPESAQDERELEGATSGGPDTENAAGGPEGGAGGENKLI